LILKPMMYLPFTSFDYKKAYLLAKVEVAKLFRILKFWHKHDILGFEKIPNEGAALIVYYHGGIPIDYLGLVVRTYLEKGRLIRSVIDRALILMPYGETVFRTFGCLPGGREEVTKLLKQGHLVGVAPGGGYEGCLATRADYPVLWKQRKGFAIVAKEAGVPIIPMFTENIKEAYVNLEAGLEFWRVCYDKTWISTYPFTPIYGGFPVKLTTHLGNPIMSTDFDTVDELRAETLFQIQKMIKRHQILPGNIYRAIQARFMSSSTEHLLEENNEEIVDDIEHFTDLFKTKSLKSLDSTLLSDSGCVSAAGSFEDALENENLFMAKQHNSTAITQLPNGRLVMFKAM